MRPALIVVLQALIPKATIKRLDVATAQRVGRYLERQGFLVRDADNSYLTPAFNYRDVVGRAMPGTIAEKTLQ